MSFDLLHASPRVLVSLGIVALALFAVWRSPTPATRLRGVLVGSAADVVAATLLGARLALPSLSWTVLMTLAWVTIPVGLGSWWIMRAAARGPVPARGYLGGLLVGLAVGWVLVPFLVGLAAVGILALTG